MRSLPARPPLRRTKPHRATNSAKAGTAPPAADLGGATSLLASDSRAGAPCERAASRRCTVAGSVVSGRARGCAAAARMSSTRPVSCASDASSAGGISSGSRAGGFTRPNSLEVSDASRLMMSSSPRCSAFLFGFSRPVIDVQQFLRQPHEVEIPRRLLVVLQNGLARARRLRQLDVLVDGCAQHQRLEEALNLLAHFPIHLLPLVVEVHERADHQVIFLKLALHLGERLHQLIQ